MVFDVWKDQILLWWDGKMPTEANPKHYSLYKERPDTLLGFWEHIAPYARYSQKLKCFMLAFSKQNLQRLKRQFPEIRTGKGQSLIEALKEKDSLFRDMQEYAAILKESPLLPDYGFKCKPLGEYQHRGFALLSKIKKFPLFADCGLGKSWMVLVSSEYQIADGLIPAGSTLICVKLLTLETSWLEDARKFTNLNIVSLWEPSGSKRKQKILAKLDSPADIYIINHDGVRLFERELAAKRFQKVVVDESTILKGYHGGRFKGGHFGRSLLNVAAHAKWRVIMSGTPASNGAGDLWGQYHFLDPEGFILEKTFNDFNARFMKTIFFGNPNNDKTPKKYVPKEGTLEEIADLINPLTYRVRIRDHLHDLPEKTVIKRYVSMAKEQSQHYKKMKEDLSTTINDKFVSADIKLAQLMKLRQITGGFLIDHQEEAHPIPDNPKLDMLDTLINDEIDQEAKVIIYAQYRWEVETIRARYKNFVSVYGGNKAETNMANIKAFIQNPDVRGIVLHPKSAAHGITFTVAHYMIFYSSSYSAEDNYQCIARIERAGQKFPMFIYYLLCKGTIDETIDKAVELKTVMQQDIIDREILEAELEAEREGPNLQK